MDTVASNARMDTHGRIAAGRANGAKPSIGRLEAIWYLAALSCVAVAGLVNMYRPLYGDSALFLLGAEGMSRGDVLYVDFWDNKQPGIYAFYYVAGRLFGFTAPGMHVLEVCWMLAFAAVLCVAVRPCLRWPWLSGIAPLILATVYYFHTQPRHLMQVEGLVGLPTFVSAWLLARDWQCPRARSIGYALAGVAAAVAVVFKLAFAILFIVFVLMATTEQVRRCRPAAPIAFVARLWMAFTGGVILVLGIVVVVFAANGALKPLLWTTFTYPSLVLSEIDRGLIEVAPASRLAGSLIWFAASVAPWLAFAAVGVTRCFRRGEAALLRLMLAWLVIGLVVILLQRFSWWQYHFTLLFAPMAVIAVRGVDVVATWLSDLGLSPRRTLAATVFFLILPPMAAVAVPAGHQFQSMLQILSSGGGRAEQIAEYQQHESDTYRRLIPVADAIGAPDSLPGDIYVFGDPLIYLFSGRRQALPVHGWSWQMFVEPLWQQLPADLLTHRPAYIFLIPYFRDLFKQREPLILETIETHYEVLEETPEGTWYRLRQSAT